MCEWVMNEFFPDLSLYQPICVYVWCAYTLLYIVAVAAVAVAIATAIAAAVADGGGVCANNKQRIYIFLFQNCIRCDVKHLCACNHFYSFCTSFGVELLCFTLLLWVQILLLFRVIFFLCFSWLVPLSRFLTSSRMPCAMWVVFYFSSHLYIKKKSKAHFI